MVPLIKKHLNHYNVVFNMDYAVKNSMNFLPKMQFSY